MDRHEWKGADGVARFASKTHAPIFYDQRVTDELRGVLESVNDEILRLASDLKAKDSENVSLRQRVQELERSLRMAHDYLYSTGRKEGNTMEYIRRALGLPKRDHIKPIDELFSGFLAVREALGGKP